jgi:hypothetical protein
MVYLLELVSCCSSLLALRVQMLYAMHRMIVLKLLAVLLFCIYFPSFPLFIHPSFPGFPILYFLSNTHVATALPALVWRVIGQVRHVGCVNACIALNLRTVEVENQFMIRSL